MVSERYSKAYKEVIEVLKHTKREDVNKIPKEKVAMWKANMRKDYDFKILKNKSLEEQGLSDEAKAIIANIYKDYWATDSEREKIKSKENKELEDIEQAKFGLEDLEKLFKENQSNETEENCTSVVAIEKKMSFFSRLVSSIKRLFK